MTPLTEAAAEYVGAGLHVLALTRKRPNGRFHEEWSYENSIHGTIQSDADIEGLEAVFGHASTTGVAILIPPAVLVADVDTEEAAALFLELAAGLPDTPVGKTPNGLHVWYHVPAADGTVWLGGRTLLFKGMGGYVAAPPSRHFDEDGKEDCVYTWI